MKAYTSISSGVVIGLDEYDRVTFTASVVGEHQWRASSLPHLVSYIDDWEEIDWRDEREQLDTLARRHRTAQLINCCMALLEGQSADLEEEVLLLVEEFLQRGASSKAALSRLLIAPLKESWRATHLAKVSLSLNCSATAQLFDDLESLQPLLLRFSSIWLSLPAWDFVEFDKARAEIWVSLAEQQLNRRLLECQDQNDFKKHWQSLVFNELRPSARSAISALGNQLAESLFPEQLTRSEPLPGLANDVAQEDENPLFEDNRHTHAGPAVAPDVKFNRALKQIENISRAIAKGDDSKAQLFLRELIDSQSGADAEYAVKSLCNIAKRCGDLYRADFERQCLEKALELKPDDSWTLIQWGDHLKRTGQFDKAIDAFRQAGVYGEPLVASTAIADVWRMKGNYNRALDVYHSIPDWRDHRLIRMATADILRFKGQFPEAITEYNAILSRWPLEARAKVGLAEIHKRRGDLGDALRLYNEVLLMQVEDERSWHIFRSARCHILKLSGRLEEALESADQLVREAPFHMDARLQRASILALLGKAQQGLLDIPELTPSAFGEWKQNYLRGLLLFKLGHYADARRLLLARLNSTFVQHETLYQLVAAYAYLQLDQADASEAQNILIGVNNLDDVHAEHIRLVLALHVATIKQDQTRAHEIRKALTAPAKKDPVLQNTLLALARKDFKKVLELELKMFLDAA